MDNTQFFQDLVERFQSIVQCESASLYVFNSENSRLELKAATGRHSVLLTVGASFEIGEGITGWIALNGKPFYTNSIEELSSFARRGRYDEPHKVQTPATFLGVPLMFQEGESRLVVGVFRAEGKIGENKQFTDADVTIAQSFADLATMAIRLRNEATTLRNEKETLGKFVYAFVLMPFAQSFDDVYKYGIKKPITELGIKCERVDEIQYTGGILDQVLKSIDKATFVIADMTGRNPNVFYEVGYCHAVKKNVILCTQEADDIPFDLRGYNHIVYHGKIKLLEEEIRKRALALLEQDTENQVN
jgi:hypothetical protein